MVDRRILATLCVLGSATLLPWNIFITESQYFDVRAHQQPTIAWLADGVRSLIPLFFQVPNVLALVVSLKYQQYLSLDMQVIGPLIITLTVVLLAAVVAAVPQMSGTMLLTTTLPGCVLLGLTSALLQAGVYALAARYGPAYIQSAISGQGLAGLAVALLSLASRAAVALQPDTGTPTVVEVSRSACRYFLGAASVVAASLGCYIYIRRSVSSRPQPQLVVVDTEAPLLEGDHLAAADSGSATTNGAAANGAAHGAAAPLLPKAPPRGGLAGLLDAPIVADVLWPLSGYAAVVITNFAITLSVFPSITSSIASLEAPPAGSDGAAAAVAAAPGSAMAALAALAMCSGALGLGSGGAGALLRHGAMLGTGAAAANGARQGLWAELFVPLGFVMFNLGDVVGRLMASAGPWKQRPPPMRLLTAYALARCAIPFALLFCNVVTSHPWRPPLLLRHDVWPVLLILLHGVTNGHLGILALMHAPSAVAPSVRDKSGPVMSFCVVFGCIVGGFVSWLVMTWLQG